MHNARSSAASLLGHLCHELLGCRLLISGVSRVYWYVFCKLTKTLTTNVIDTATGIAYIHESQKPGWYYTSGGPFDSIVSYHSISLSLNILLTLAIIVQIFLHARNIRDATGAYLGGVGSHAAYVVTILVESYALYAVSYLLYLILAAANSPSVEVFSTVLVASQVCVALFCFSSSLTSKRLSDHDG